MTYVLNLSHVSVQRGDTQVLSDVSWSTRPRQHWVIVGPNGAGKTTLARVASGRIAPDSGEVTVSETDLLDADPAEIATRVGLSSAAVGAQIVPTQPVLDPVRSAGPDGVDACRFCDMRAVCRFEGQPRELAPMGAARFWELVTQEEGGGEHE